MFQFILYTCTPGIFVNFYSNRSDILKLNFNVS